MRPSDDPLDKRLLVLQQCLQLLVLDDQRILTLLRLTQDAAQAGDPDMLGRWSSAAAALVVGICDPVLQAGGAFVIIMFCFHIVLLKK